MTGSEIIRTMCKAKKITVKHLSELLECSHQNLKNRQYRDTYAFNDIVHIADLLGFDIVAVERVENPTEVEA